MGGKPRYLPQRTQRTQSGDLLLELGKTVRSLRGPNNLPSLSRFLSRKAIPSIMRLEGLNLWLKYQNRYKSLVRIVSLLVIILLLNSSALPTVQASFTNPLVDINLYDLDVGKSTKLNKKVKLWFWQQPYALTNNHVAWFEDEGHNITIRNLTTQNEITITIPTEIISLEMDRDILFMTTITERIVMSYNITSEQYEEQINITSLKRKSITNLDVNKEYFVYTEYTLWDIFSIKLIKRVTNETINFGPGYKAILYQDEMLVTLGDKLRNLTLINLITNETKILSRGTSGLYPIYLDDEIIIWRETNDTVAVYDRSLERVSY